MNVENIIWAFFSAQHYQTNIEQSLVLKLPKPKDVYYKDNNGNWVKVTAAFDCIDQARKNYKLADLKYLGAVDSTTKTEVEAGAPFPPPEPKPTSAAVSVGKKPTKKKKLEKSNIPDIYDGLNYIINKKKYFSYYDE